MKAKVILYKSKKLKNGTSPLMLRITKNRVRKYISIGYSVNEADWNSKAERAKGRSPKAKELNRIIEKTEINALTLIQKLSENRRNVSLDDIVFTLKNNDKSESVFSFWEKRIKNLIESNKLGNSRAYKNTYSVFKKYRKDKNLTFDELSYQEISKFNIYLLSKGLKINGISFHLRTIRALYNLAINVGVASKDAYPFERFKIKSEKTVHRALSREEVKRIRDLKPDEYSTKLAQDFFMFSFYTRGMSFIDIVNLKVNDINNDRLHYTRAKTGTKFTIKLTDTAIEIIERYANIENKDSYIFPVIQHEKTKFIEYKNAMQKTNKKLKEIGNITECSIPLTTYVARHSWATIAKRGGVSTSVISEGLGHATELITQIYLDGFENNVIDDANDLITNLD